MVLYVVVVVVAMLSLAGLSYVTVLHTENRAVRLDGDQLQAECLVASGAEAIKSYCELLPQEQEAAGGGYDNPDLFQGVPVLEEAIDGRQGRFSVVSPRIDNGEITGIRFGIENESARLNLTVLGDWDKAAPGSAREALMALPGMTESIADAILDWMDGDGTPRPFGAESDYYSGLGVPYGPRNTVPTSLEELLLVRDVTRELLFGSDANFNFRLDPGEGSSADSGGQWGVASGAGMPWASLLTVFSTERNVNPEGQPRIDLNTADLAALSQQLSTVLNDQTWVNFIIAYRQFGPLKGPPPSQEDAVPASEITPDLARPGRFRVRSVLDLFGIWVAFEEPNADRPLFVESPFPQDAQAMRDYLPKLLDWTTIDRRPIVRGRINVNLAPRPVLAAVPGLDDELVERIVSARASGGDFQSPAWRYPTWLLTEGVVDLERMQQILPYLTAGGDVYRAQVVGFFDTPGPTARAEVVIDATRTPPRQIYWKDLRLLGPGFGAAELAGGSARGDVGVGVE